MSEIVIPPRKGYTVIPNGILPEGISARAWGIYAYLLSRPEGWVCRPRQLMQVFKEGRDALYAAVNELCDRGLLVKQMYRDEQNMPRYRYVMPDPENLTQVADPPNPGNPDSENPDYNHYRSLTTTEEQPLTAPPSEAAEKTGLLPHTYEHQPKVCCLIARWHDGFHAARGDEAPDPSVLKRVKGQSVAVAKDRRTKEDWDRALDAAFSAGEQGIYDIVNAMPVQRQSQFRSRADEEREVYGGFMERMEARKLAN